MEENYSSDIFRILSVTPNLIQVEVRDVILFRQNADDFTIGSYLRIYDELNVSIIAIVQGYRIKELAQGLPEEEPREPFIVIDAQPIGFLDDSGKFRRGGQKIAIPPNGVEIADQSLLEKIYGTVSGSGRFLFANLAQNHEVEVAVDGDKFFGKHIAIVGSTGSGKSGTVAKILQEGIKRSAEPNHRSILNNAHILLLDLHGEYRPAFPKANNLNVDSLVLPYWLMNSEELEEMFIESQESNSHNQVSQFKYAVTLNKKKYNTHLPKVNYDSPVYFSLEEVFQYIVNQNEATKDAKTGEVKISGEVPNVKKEYLFFEKLKFEEKKPSIVNGGPYNGEFNRFVPRLEVIMNDDRLAFLLRRLKADGTEYKTEDLAEILRKLIGYVIKGEANITIIDLSGIPFEVLSVVVSLISRLLFDFCFHHKSIKKAGEEVPVLLVLEEAHNYIPQSEGAKYKSVKKSIERIAKEGRKYGLSLMIVSQRPSEISETIFSQCNNFVAMRLTNPTDQQYVKRLMPDSVSAITETLPILERQEALLIGDSIPIPTIVRIMDLVDKPASDDIAFRTEWNKDWVDTTFAGIIKRMTREE